MCTLWARHGGCAELWRLQRPPATPSQPRERGSPYWPKAHPELVEAQQAVRVILVADSDIHTYRP